MGNNVGVGVWDEAEKERQRRNMTTASKKELTKVGFEPTPEDWSLNPAP
jgi:hypothetical protein